MIIDLFADITIPLQFCWVILGRVARKIYPAGEVRTSFRRYRVGGIFGGDCSSFQRDLRICSRIKIPDNSRNLGEIYHGPVKNVVADGRSSSVEKRAAQ